MRSHFFTFHWRLTCLYQSYINVLILSFSSFMHLSMFKNRCFLLLYFPLTSHIFTPVIYLCTLPCIYVIQSPIFVTQKWLQFCLFLVCFGHCLKRVIIFVCRTLLKMLLHEDPEHRQSVYSLLTYMRMSSSSMKVIIDSL